MDFSGCSRRTWAAHRYTFDARHNTPRIGRVLIRERARCRRCRDKHLVRIEPVTTFRVWTDEVGRQPCRPVSQPWVSRCGRLSTLLGNAPATRVESLNAMFTPASDLRRNASA